MAAMRMRRQKSSGEGGGKAWSRGNRRAVRGGRGVNNWEWSWNKGCYFSDQRRECVLNQFLKGREWLQCDGWAERVKSLQKENRHQRPYTVFRSKSALPEQFIPSLACSQGTFSFITLTAGLGLGHEADEQNRTICRTVPAGLFPEDSTAYGTWSPCPVTKMSASHIKRQEKSGTGGPHVCDTTAVTKSTCMEDVK